MEWKVKPFDLERALRQCSAIQNKWAEKAPGYSGKTRNVKAEYSISKLYEKNCRNVTVCLLDGSSHNVFLSLGTHDYLEKKLNSSGGAFCAPSTGSIFIGEEVMNYPDPLRAWVIGHELGHIAYNKNSAMVVEQDYNKIMAEEIFSDNYSFELNRLSLDDLLTIFRWFVQSGDYYHFPRMKNIVERCK